MICLVIRANFAVLLKARASSAWNTRYRKHLFPHKIGVLTLQNHMPVLPNVQVELQEACCTTTKVDFRWMDAWEGYLFLFRSQSGQYIGLYETLDFTLEFIIYEA